jgi:hypothetical protein
MFKAQKNNFTGKTRHRQNPLDFASDTGLELYRYSNLSGMIQDAVDTFPFYTGLISPFSFSYTLSLFCTVFSF